MIVHCATTLGKGDIQATRHLIDAARQAGRPHLVYISIVGVDRVPAGMPAHDATGLVAALALDVAFPALLLVIAGTAKRAV